MSRARDLENRLREWGAEKVRGGSYGYDFGYGNSWLASIIKWHGRAPAGIGYEPTVSGVDEVEQAVSALEAQRSGQLPASVLREHYTSSRTREERCRKLGISTVRYSQLLRLAKWHVAGWLRIPFDEPLPPDEQVGMLECITGLD